MNRHDLQDYTLRRIQGGHSYSVPQFQDMGEGIGDGSFFVCIKVTLYEHECKNRNCYPNREPCQGIAVVIVARLSKLVITEVSCSNQDRILGYR